MIGNGGLKAQHGRLDVVYLHHRAEVLGVQDLLAQAAAAPTPASRGVCCIRR